MIRYIGSRFLLFSWYESFFPFRIRAFRVITRTLFVIIARKFDTILL